MRSASELITMEPTKWPSSTLMLSRRPVRIFYGYAWSVLLARIPNALVLSAVNIVLLRILLENRSLMKLAKK